MPKINKNYINIEGARENNLKNINVKIPKDKLVVVTGVSGSGKSSLAFDTLYAEGYRRYMENLSGFARYFLQTVKKPQVSKIENLSPAIAIDQKTTNQNPRSTMGTLTGVYDFLRHLYANVGVPYCPNCQVRMQKQDLESIIEKIRQLPDETQVAILAIWPEQDGSLKEKIGKIENLGFARIRIGENPITAINDFKKSYLAGEEKIDPAIKIQIVVDRVLLDKSRFDRERLIDSLQSAVKISNGQALILIDNRDEIIFNKYNICPKCGFTIKKISPKDFSFNSPQGACGKCTGLGRVAQVDAERVIPNKKLSLLEGAIMPWSKNGGRLGIGSQELLALEALARKYKFSLKSPVSKISNQNIDRIIYGEEEPLEIESGKQKKVKFDGVAAYLQEKFNKADSILSRSEYEKYLSLKTCPDCEGRRLKKHFLNVRVFDQTIDRLAGMEIAELVDLFENILKIPGYKNGYTDGEVKIIDKFSYEIILRLNPLISVGLDYLDLNRGCQTLSGGEFQRTRLATQLYSGLGNVVYILDEPSMGLHGRDTMKLISTLRQIREGGNSVVVVEHDKDIIKAADYLIDLGPGAGEDGGNIIFQGDIKKLEKAKTQTSLYVNGVKGFSSRNDKSPVKEKITIREATENNLKKIDVSIPLKKLVAIVGVSGSGKSSLVNDILAKGLRKEVMGSYDQPGKHKEIEGIKNVSKVVIVDQSPIGRSPRSNAATYTGIFGYIRELFAKTEMSKQRHLNASHFSFNMRGGRCEYCQGEGIKKIEMHLLDDVFSVCTHCQGTRYNKKILEVLYHGQNIADILNMNVDYAKEFFNSHNPVFDKLLALSDVGLGYLRLGQSATELSGGEAQRVKLASELGRKVNGNAIYILDEPTIGLHFSDIEKLLKVLHGLVDRGNSVIVVEHNPDFIKVCDYAIELGPEGGRRGGIVVFEGAPSKLIKVNTWTGRALAGKL